MAGGAVRVEVPEEDEVMAQEQQQVQEEDGEGEHVEDEHRDERREQMKPETRDNLMAKRSKEKWNTKETGRRARTNKKQWKARVKNENGEEEQSLRRGGRRRHGPAGGGDMREEN